MITFTELSLRNFLSYGNVPTTIKFNEKNLILIQGLVGSGKSSISKALNFCLYNKIENSNVDSLINNINQKNMEISVIFHKKEYGYYKVLRCRKLKTSGQEGNFVKIFYNPDEPIFDESHNISLDGTRTTDEKIIDILGINFEMFIRMVNLNANTEDFLNLPTSSTTNKLSQQGFLEKLFNLDLLNEKAVALKESIKETDSMVKEQLIKIERIIKEQERFNAQIENAKQKSNEHQSTVSETITKYHKQLEQINAIDIDKEKQYIEKSLTLKNELQTFKQEHRDISYKINSIVDEKKKLEQQIESLTHKSKEHDLTVQNNINTLNEKLKTLLEIDIEMEKQYIELSNKVKDELKDIQNTMKELNEHYKHHNSVKDSMAKELESLNDSKCPRCNQHFHSQEDIANCTKIIQESEIEIDRLYKQLSELKEIKAVKMLDYEKYTSKISVNGLEDLITIQNNIEKVKDKINDLSNYKNVYSEQLSEILEKTKDADDDEKMLDSLFKKLEDLESIMMDKKKSYDSIIENATITDLEELVTLKNRAEHIKDKINDLHKSKNVYMEHLAELENVELENADYEGLDKIKNILNHQQFLHKLLSSKNSFIRKNLLSSNLKFLNSRIAEYLQYLNFPYLIKFEDDLTSTIKYLGRDISFGLLSSGQRNKVKLTLLLAFMDINKKNTTWCNLLILDEMVDSSYDPESLQLVISLLKKKAEEENLNMFVVSHRESITHRFENVMSISREDEFSVIKYNWKSSETI